MVQLYLLTVPVVAGVVIAELSSDRWWRFSDAFDVLVDQHFGAAGFCTLPSWSTSGVLLLLFGWMLASNIGLLWFRRWARFGSWASVLLMSLVMMAIDGYRPGYTSPGYDIAMIIDGALFGAIMLLAYARNFGDLWFAPVAGIGK